MNARIVGRFLIIAVMWLATAHVGYAQGFAGLGTTADGFLTPTPDGVITFPDDHGAHAGYRIEWWYLTSNLKGDDGKTYGVQWTLFRSAIRPTTNGENDGASSGWSSPQLWMGHAAITSKDRHYVAETRARGGIGLAGASVEPFKAWIDDWEMRSLDTSSRGISDLTVSASGADFSYNLRLSTLKPIIFHGQNGYSVKSAEGQASYYYSQPFYAAEGMLNLPTGSVNVVGSAWLDREWSSQPLGENQKGWDWVSLNFDDGSKLMGFQLRQDLGAPFTSATWIDADGTTQSLPNGSIEMTPLDHSNVEGRRVPTQWRINLPIKKIDIKISALNPHAWMKTSVPYWEGPVKISGSHKGNGYLEMTGY